MINSVIFRLTKPKLAHRIWKKITSFLFMERWIVLISKSANPENPAFEDFEALASPYDRDWADPFLLRYQDNTYLFFEEKLFSNKNGHISFLSFDQDMNITSSGIALKRPYHLSYPFLFVYDKQLYMLPETKGNHAIELYRCVSFPDQWEFHTTLMSNVNAVDATLLEEHGKWWLFVNIASEGKSAWTDLHLFFADNPLSNSWTAHPKNPIVEDVNTSRPAGNIIKKNGKLVRPSQDCSVRYGYATNFMNIMVLSETEYTEIRERTFTPPLSKNVLGIHTWNEKNGITVIDAMVRIRKKFNQHGYNKIGA